MNLRDLAKDSRNSIQDTRDVDGATYSAAGRVLERFKFWPAPGNTDPELWEHQEAAISLCVAYLNAERRIALEGISNEAALVKMATGTGKSAIIAVLSRCLSDEKIELQKSN